MHAVQLNTFLEFINLELQEASEAELIKAAMFVSSAFVPPQLRFRLDLKIMAPKLEKLLQQDGAVLKQTQTRLKTILAEIEQWSKNPSLSQEEKNSDKHGDVYHSLFELDMTATVNLLAQVGHFGVKAENVSEKTDIISGPFPMSLALTFHDLESAIVYHFVKALEGTDVSNIRTCPVCSKWFIQQTRRKRVYCSNSCASRDGNRRRYWEKRPDKDIKNGSEDIIRHVEIYKK